MIHRFLAPLLLGMALSGFAWSAGGLTSGAPAAASVVVGGTLPAAIRSTLDEEYPGWEFAGVSAEVRKEFAKFKGHHPSLVTGDFDHDGRRDYATQIALHTPGQEEQIIIIFLGRPDSYEEHIVQSMGIDPSVCLWVKNLAIDDTGTHPDTLVSKDVLLVLGGPVGRTAYSYDAGKFHEIVLTEDPSAPDVSMPTFSESTEKAEP